jgi:hypothetical protein
MESVDVVICSGFPFDSAARLSQSIGEGAVGAEKLGPLGESLLA